MSERNRDTTSECEDTESGSERSTSPTCDNSPGVDNSTPLLDDTRNTSPESDNANDYSALSDNTFDADTIVSSSSAANMLSEHDHGLPDDVIPGTAPGCVEADVHTLAGLDNAHCISPVFDNTLEEQAANAVDVVATCSGELGSSHTVAAANDPNASWSVRGSAYTALTWMSGVVSRSIVRSLSERATNVDNQQVAATASEASIVTATENEETACSGADVENDVVNSSPADAVTAEVGVSQTIVANSMTVCQSPAPSCDSLGSTTPCDAGHDFSESGKCHHDDVPSRYLCIL